MQLLQECCLWVPATMDAYASEFQGTSATDEGVYDNRIDLVMVRDAQVKKKSAHTYYNFSMPTTGNDLFISHNIRRQCFIVNGSRAIGNKDTSALRHVQQNTNMQ